jgi:hypothetical protein
VWSLEKIEEKSSQLIDNRGLKLGEVLAKKRGTSVKTFSRCTAIAPAANVQTKSFN